ncbi:heparan-alpha-glucosaminide N-acetyltransferase domain-containing protein [Microbacterium chocolatum]|uniref:heparan-alpha-glucosaminide N-acetyltransferase domain-containing protein n=1 Tax=Microbacterium aurantiacum TaxID=162393 RepID=UPI00338FE924
MTIAANVSRLNSRGRITGLDLARGLAVVGMLAAHLLVITGPFALGDPDTWVAVVDGRSSILFATVAGVSIGLMTGGASPPRGTDLTSARVRIAIRAGILWVLGILLILTGVPVYVILPAYAVLFLLTLPVLTWGTRALAILATILGLVMPFIQVLLDDLPIWSTPLGGDLSLALGWNYPFPTWIAFILAGLAVARADIRKTTVQLRVLVVGIALALIGYGADAATGYGAAAEETGWWPAVWTARPHSSGLLEIIGSGGFALAVIAAGVLGCRVSVVMWAVLPLRAVGAMPLTAYTAQLVVWAAIAAVVLGNPGDLSGFRALEPFWPMTIGIIAVCTVWALLVGRGPLEAVLDRASGRPRPRR